MSLEKLTTVVNELVDKLKEALNGHGDDDDNDEPIVKKLLETPLSTTLETYLASASTVLTNPFAASSATNTSSYAFFQLRIFCYLIIFLFGSFFILTHKYELNRVKHSIVDKFIIYIFNRSQIKRTVDYLKRFFNYVNRNFSYRSIQLKVRSISYALSTIFNYFFHRNSTNTNLADSSYSPSSSLSSGSLNKKTYYLGHFIYEKFKSFFLLFYYIRQSVSAIYSAAPLGLMRSILLWPVRLRDGYRLLASNIGSFRRQMEQMIQIIRLPIAILTLIFRFLANLTLFLKGLQKPKVPKLR